MQGIILRFKSISLEFWSIVLISFIWCCVINPGYLFWDSCRQWQWAIAIRDHGFPVKLLSLNITMWWSIFMTLAKVPFLYLPKGVFFYIFLQSFLCGISILFLFRRMYPSCQGLLRIVPILVFMMPITLNYSVFHSSDVFVFIVLMFVFGVLITPIERKNKFDAAIFIFGCMFMVLTRYNAIFLVVFLVIYLLFTTKHKGFSLSIILIASLLIGIVRFYELTAVPVDVSAEGMAMRLWEMKYKIQDERLDQFFRFNSEFCIIRHKSQQVPDLNSIEKFKVKYKSNQTTKSWEFIRDILIRNTTKMNRPFAKACYEKGCWCTQWQEWKRLKNISNPKINFLFNMDSALVRREYFRLFIEQPRVWGAVNWKFTTYWLGISSPIPETEIGKTKNILPPSPDLVMNLNQLHQWGVASLKFTQRMFFGFFSRPYILFILTTMMFFILKQRRMAFAYVLCVILYIVPLLLGSPSRDFRYFFPVIGLSYTILAFQVTFLIQSICQQRAVKSTI